MTDDNTIVMLADFYRQGDGIAESFRAPLAFSGKIRSQPARCSTASLNPRLDDVGSALDVCANHGDVLLLAKGNEWTEKVKFTSRLS